MMYPSCSCRFDTTRGDGGEGGHHLGNGMLHPTPSDPITRFARLSADGFPRADEGEMGCRVSTVDGVQARSVTIRPVLYRR